MWNFWNGYVILQAEGLSLARFLRRIADAGFRIRQIRQDHAGTVRFAIGRKQFFQLHRLKSGLRLRIHICKRCGFPFLLAKMRKRPVLCIGTAIVLIGIFLASQRIWTIRIEDNETIDTETILALLDEHGLRIGAKPKGPVLITAANDLSARIHDAAWIGLDREGVTLKVSVVEAVPQSETRNLDTPSDLVAAKEGIITNVTVLHGQACVKAGDKVKAGDVLISGTVVRNDASYETWANGTVLAAIRYEAVCEVVPTVLESVLTDRIQTMRSLRIGSWTLFCTRSDFEHYRVSDTHTVPVGDRFPTYCDLFTVQEIVFRERSLSEQEAEQLALLNAREAALEQVPKDASVLNQYGTIRRKDGKLYAVVIVTAEESIGRTEEYPHDG